MSSSINIISNPNQVLYDFFVEREGGHLCQSFSYGKVQELSSRSVVRYIFEQGGKTVGAFQMIEFPLPFQKKYGYIPHGPVVSNNASEETLREMVNTMRSVAKERQLIFLRFDPYPIQLQSHPIFSGRNIVRPRGKSARGAFFQPQNEWALDLKNGWEHIYAKMDGKARYAIKLSGKRNVEAEIITENIQDRGDEFISLL